MQILRWTGFVASVCCLSGLSVVAVRAGGSASGHCGGLTVADAAAILHISPADVSGPQIVEDPDLAGGYTCWYHDSKDFFKSVNFELAVEKSAAAAERDMNVEKQNFAGTAAVVAVKNLGDEAWRYTWQGYGPAPRLLMRKGNVWLDVRQPEDEASQVKIAEIVLKNLSRGH